VLSIFLTFLELLLSFDELFSTSVERLTTVTDTHLSYLPANLATSFLLAAVPGSLSLAVPLGRVLGVNREGDKGDWREIVEFFPVITGILEEVSSL
jgi:hypothetical protein